MLLRLSARHCLLPCSSGIAYLRSSLPRFPAAFPVSPCSCCLPPRSLSCLPRPSIGVANMRWHRGQQLYLAVAAVVPGVLVYLQLVKPPYAALMLVFLYFLSKRHGFLLQRQFEREEHARLTRENDERLASLSKRKRRDAERAKKRQQDDVASASGSDHPKDE